VQLDELTVTSLIEDGVAEKGGMLTGDVLLKIDGANVSGREEISRALQAGEPKKKVVVIRDGKEVELTLDWGPPPKK